ncbi:MAG: hypothetical protein OXU51_14005 [Candidatus Poribacteria bacterium]|nr:hypothetical protein [Candidatus Poribacteria bacterium]
MFNILFFFYSRTLFFKRSRETLSNLVSVCYRKLFGIKPAILEDITKLKTLLKITLSKLGWIILISVLLQSSRLYIDPYLVSWLTERGVNIPQNTDYGTLLAAVIGVGGVFIGLYYTAISGVCSAIYANKPNNIRDLLALDRVSSFYMNWLAMLTSFGVLLLGLNALGYQPAILAALLLVLGAGWMVFAFIQLGKRAFNLFDPTTFSKTIFGTLRKHSKRMQAGGYHWSNQLSQSKSHDIARNALDTLITLSDITAKEIHLNGRPFADMCKNMLSFLYDYEMGKKSIPTDSLWYRRRYVHPDRYRTYDEEISPNHESTTGVKPRLVSDLRWLEFDILPIVKCCLQINIEHKRYDIIDELLGDLDRYVQRLAKEQEIEAAFDLISDIFSWCEEHILLVENAGIIREPLEYMKICQQLATMPINVLSVYIDAIKFPRREAISELINRVVWKSTKSIYRVGFASHTLDLLEELRPKLIFEQKVEGRIISESWYIEKMIAQKEAKNLHTAMICFYEKARDIYARWVTLSTPKRPWLTAQMMSIEWTYWSMLDSQPNALQQLWNDLNLDDE